MVKLTIAIIITALFIPVPAISAYNADSLFAAACRFYESKDYSSALQNYLQLEKDDHISAALYFNIGNCYFKEGKIGYSILYYLRAQHLKPNDDDISSNLAFARQFMPTTLEGVRINPVTSFFNSVVSPFTLNGWAWISSLLFVLLMLFLSALVYFGWRGFQLKIAGYALFFLLIISSSLTTYKYRTEYLTRRGVVVADQAQVFSGPGEDNNVEFNGAFGLTFEIEKESGDYYLVIFENGRKGWIGKNRVEII